MRHGMTANKTGNWVFRELGWLRWKPGTVHKAERRYD